MTKLKGADLSHQNPGTPSLRGGSINQLIAPPFREGVPEGPVCEHVNIDYSPHPLMSVN